MTQRAAADDKLSPMRSTTTYLCQTQDDNAPSTIIKPDVESDAAANVIQRGPIFTAFWNVTSCRRVEILSVPRNFGTCLPDYMASHHRRREFSVTGVKKKKTGYKIIVSGRTTFR
jgi:hypothetical protein